MKPLGPLLAVLVSATACFTSTCRSDPGASPSAAPAGPGTTAATLTSSGVPSPAVNSPSATSPAAASPEPPPGPVHVEPFPEESAHVLRGSSSRSQAVLFGGQCSQPQGYVEAIQHAAARRTQLVALQGDKPCTGDYRGWTFDLDALSRRIERTFRALGLGEPRDVLLIGYSQGASVAELLAAKEPERYTRLVLIAQPRKPDPWRLRKARSVVTMAGTLDMQETMVRGARALSNAGVRARYFPLPGAAHGDMGTDPEGTFEQVLAWLDEPPGNR